MSPLEDLYYFFNGEGEQLNFVDEQCRFQFDGEIHFEIIFLKNVYIINQSKKCRKIFANIFFDQRRSVFYYWNNSLFFFALFVLREKYQGGIRRRKLQKKNPKFRRKQNE